MNRRFSLILILLFFSFLSACGSSKSTVIDIVGTVALTGEEGRSDFNCVSGTVVNDKDTLSVGSESSAWVRLDSSKTVLLSELTEASFSISEQKYVLNLVKGTILLRTDKPLTSVEAFDVSVRSIYMVINSAVYSVQADEYGLVILNVFQGEVIIYAGESELLRVNAGQSLSFDANISAFSSQPSTIDYKLLPNDIFECVKDYKADTLASETATPEETSAQPDPLTPSPLLEASTEPLPFPSDLPELSESPNISLGEGSQHIEASPPALASSSPLPLVSSETEPSVSPRPEKPSITPSATPQPSVVPSESPSVSPSTSSEPSPSIGPVEESPKIIFKYLWTGLGFMPHVSVLWQTGADSYIDWQVFDESGAALAESGRIETENGEFSIKDIVIDLISSKENGLFPKNYTLKLIPFFISATTKAPTPLLSSVMELPYFEVDTEITDGVKKPVISTNIGFYFKHAYDSISEATVGEGFRIKGSFLPLKGTEHPLNIDIYTD